MSGNVWRFEGAASGVPVASTQILRAVSTAADQQPSALDTALQVEFGAAQLGPTDPVQLAADGTLTINEAGSYFVLAVFQFGRTGSAQVSHLYGRVLVNGSQVLNSVHARIEDGDVLIPLQLDIRFVSIPAGAAVTFEIIRDSAGNNSGGLFQADPTPTGWEVAPSASITVYKLEIA